MVLLGRDRRERLKEGNASIEKKKKESAFELSVTSSILPLPSPHQIERAERERSADKRVISTQISTIRRDFHSRISTRKIFFSLPSCLSTQNRVCAASKREEGEEVFTYQGDRSWPWRRYRRQEP